ncbi:hypothetical protein RUE5091_00217 [Ruegeria denitrificans]|uniref:Uncharacterized protein n=1 Tax=Ruegeria denitrificans TaxID=1715692 RepID=A0A0P1IA82_9RHOB|nr:hypothetical protein RUE5091_00217 [Ruegeria denitrificans]
MAYYNLGDDDFPDTESTLSAIFAEVIRQGKSGTDLFGLRLQGKSRAFFFSKYESFIPAPVTISPTCRPSLVASASSTSFVATNWNRLFRW